jgi:hypothetical protein
MHEIRWSGGTVSKHRIRLEGNASAIRIVLDKRYTLQFTAAHSFWGQCGGGKLKGAEPTQVTGVKRKRVHEIGRLDMSSPRAKLCVAKNNGELSYS